ncbi:MAG: hypothetical protein CM1200mP28_09710 [Deltaproteobacteria bacterium]|nr:MAG: hypothetical protein CM1200mP28_09710 [Deltaproteobacteria bacterium]
MQENFGNIKRFADHHKGAVSSGDWQDILLSMETTVLCWIRVVPEVQLEQSLIYIVQDFLGKIRHDFGRNWGRIRCSCWLRISSTTT